jgi:hypothetical protein
MGEVYRARDPRLRRDVAIKVVRSALSAQPEHVERLTREARAVGRLNHPNIVGVYDVGTEGGVPYVVSELLQGESLRDRLAKGRLQLRKALDVAVHVAQALGAAHDQGIWHRDVKPGNIFLTTDGRVKLLDFGLATRALPAHADPDDSTASSSDPSPGRGTAGYMSPEQVLGLPLDQRSDIFAFGAVLYEMLTGQRAFPRTAEMGAMDAVVKTEPVDARDIRPDVPDVVAGVVRRCLEKNKEERYQSARDLAFQLDQIHQALEGSRSSSSFALAFGKQERRVVTLTGLLMGAAGIAAGIVAGVMASRLLRQPSENTFEQLTFRRGRIGGARFASEGRAVLYSESRPTFTATGQRTRLEVWRVDLAESPGSPSFVFEGGDVVAARPGGLAVSLRRRYVGGSRFVGTLATLPISGQGLPLERDQDVEDADWDAAGNDFVIVRRMGAKGECRLEYPKGKVLFTTTGAIRSPRMSRDGKRIAFVDDRNGLGDGGRIAIADLAGGVVHLTPPWASVRGIAWSSTGDDVWFAAAEEGGNRALRAVELSGRERVVLRTPASLTLWDVAGDRVLLTRDEEWSSLVGRRPGWTAERDLSWLDASGVADLSDDGQTLLFGDRFGIYTRGTDGSPPRHLGLNEGFADDLSPDGTMALATSATTDELMVLPTGAGEPKRVPKYGFSSYKGALWCPPDGRRIVFNATLPGQDVHAYVQDLSAGGEPKQLTPKDTAVLAISPDGHWAAATEPGKGVSLWPLDGGPAQPLTGSQPQDRPVAFTADGRALWVFRRGEVPAPVFRVSLQGSSRELWKTLWPPDPAGVYSIINFKITPRGDTYFYSYAGVLSQLYLVRGLR